MAQGPARIASGSSAWVDITGKPSTFPPSAHTQAWSTITTTPTTLTGYGITDAQPLDSDLTSIAALTTTTFGRSLLTQADAAAARTTIGAGTSSFNGAYASLTGIPSTFTPTAHNQAWSTITTTPTTLSGYGITDAQPLDSALTALAGLSTTGLVARTGSGTAAARTITGTANQVIVTNGDGVNGNPTLALPGTAFVTDLAHLGTRADFGDAMIRSSALSLALLTAGSHEISFGLAWDPSDARYEHVVNSGAGYGGSIVYSSLTGAFKINLSSDSAANGEAATVVTVLSISSTGALALSKYGAGTLVTDSSGNVTASSDASLKTVTGTFTRGLADVLKLTPRTYRWNEKSGMNTEDENVGFIAQEVLESIPEAVGQYRTSEVEVDGKKTKKREKAELLTLSDRPLIAALVNAVRDLNEKNVALEERVAALEKGKATK